LNWQLKNWKLPQGDRGMGFGWSFYGFFFAAAVWLLLYFVWAWRAAVRDRQPDGR